MHWACLAEKWKPEQLWWCWRAHAVCHIIDNSALVCAWWSWMRLPRAHLSIQDNIWSAVSLFLDRRFRRSEHQSCAYMINQKFIFYFEWTYQKEKQKAMSHFQPALWAFRRCDSSYDIVRNALHLAWCETVTRSHNVVSNIGYPCKFLQDMKTQSFSRILLFILLASSKHHQNWRWLARYILQIITQRVNETQMHHEGALMWFITYISAREYITFHFIAGQTPFGSISSCAVLACSQPRLVDEQ